jgi:HSP20 family molecular chaperone IbpA
MNATLERAPSRSAAHDAGLVTYVPPFDLWEGDHEYRLIGDLPGVAPENLDVRLENGTLSIEGKVAPRSEGRNMLWEEYGVAHFHRAFEIGQDIDGQAIAAELRDGVLTIRLPKRAEVQPRRIAVQGG